MQSDIDHDEGALISSINITPFVDVVLVLLVIFMVTAPVLLKEIIEVHLPKTQTSDGQVLQTLGIAVNREGQILVNGKISDEEELKALVRLRLTEDNQTQAILAADQEVAYGKVAHVIDVLKGAGLHRFAVQIERGSAEEVQKTSPKESIQK